MDDLNRQIARILQWVEVTKHVNKNNADHSILFEAIDVVLVHEDSIWDNIKKDVVALLSKFVGVREPNIKCLALKALSNLPPSLMTH